MKTMVEEKNVKMQINIAGETIPLTVRFSQQDHVRDVEADISALYDEWRKRFVRKSDRELLAMIAYQYASYYFTLKERFGKAENEITALSGRIDDILAGK